MTTFDMVLARFERQFERCISEVRTGAQQIRFSQVLEVQLRTVIGAMGLEMLDNGATEAEIKTHFDEVTKGLSETLYGGLAVAIVEVELKKCGATRH